jgi:undecaprenyl diphosphate synthase
MSLPQGDRLPVHVGIFMDGNGRWATARGLPRTEGHREGLNVAKRIVKAAAEMGIKVLTLYTFSTENWKRTTDEVGFLMSLIKNHLSAEFDFYRSNQIKVVHSGDPAGLPADVRAEIERVQLDTASFDKLTVNLAINYGGRDEIARAARRLAERGEPITEASLSRAMDRPELPDADLIIRPGGEMRLSNFLLWESAYAELVFSPVLWPDYTARDFAENIAEYQRRERRFGGAK